MNKKPERRCIGCKNSFEKSRLIRISKTPDGKIIVDEKGKAEGRGAYICKNADCLLKAFKKNQLAYSFKIKIDEEVKQRLITSLSEIINNTETEIN